MNFPSSAYGILECTAVCTSFLSCTNQRKSINLAPPAPDPRTKPNWIGFPGTRARFSEAECLNAVCRSPLLDPIGWLQFGMGQVFQNFGPTDGLIVFQSISLYQSVFSCTHYNWVCDNNETSWQIYNKCVQFLVASLLGLSHPNKIGSIKDVTACSLNFDAECFASFGSPSVWTMWTTEATANGGGSATWGTSMPSGWSCGNIAAPLCLGMAFLAFLSKQPNPPDSPDRPWHGVNGFAGFLFMAAHRHS